VGIESDEGKNAINRLLASLRNSISTEQGKLDDRLGMSAETIDRLTASFYRKIAAEKKSKQATNEAKKAQEQSIKSIKGATGA
jgi:truncated hemoglobin YjbI